MKGHIMIFALSTLLVPLTISHSLNAATSGSDLKAPPSTQLHLAQRECSQRVGPFASQDEAQRAAQQYRYAGYRTSGVWGEGGVVSSWSNRRYYFNVLYC